MFFFQEPIFRPSFPDFCCSFKFSNKKHFICTLSETQDPTYSDDQITMIEDRIEKLRDELNERNEEIDIFKK